ncbi:hypothetical protein FK220_017905 [Flavobacteriaceae bacterium TP-CH-4]|uniref:Methane oxygenase PmoA n=2 Tax=Pelagihabitans pacificus TaxID=2696054 RepID=A0A967E757_9FLAO|nr:hypothetical protein [Pelagihabitans pacificus]
MVLQGCHSENENSIALRLDSNLTINTPVVLNIAENLKNDIVLLKTANGITEEVPFQIQGNRLWFITDAGQEGTERSAYTIRKGVRSEPPYDLSQTDTDGNLQITSNERPVLTYRYGMTYPPMGIDTIFRKSGFIHPLCTPGGDTLSRIQPPDHYHHYGLWGPWTRTKIEDRSVDFWNLGESQGTVLFKNFTSKTSGPVFSEFQAHQEHFDLTAKQGKQVAINEYLSVRVWNLRESKNRYLIDYVSTFSSPLPSGILFEAYRYGGGLGMRFTERWHKDNCTVLTSEGKDRQAADGTSARWCMVTGRAANGKGRNGILFLSHPENRSHPEPMRVWPVDGNNGRGDLFFEFCPIRHNPWHIEPQKEYRLKYRLLVFEGELNVDEAEAYWQSFAAQPWAKIVMKEAPNQ